VYTAIHAAIESSLEPRLGYIEADEIKRGGDELRRRGYKQPKLDMFLCRMVGRFGFDRVVAGVQRVQNKRLMEELKRE
jgi:hypothetical protein